MGSESSTRSWSDRAWALAGKARRVHVRLLGLSNHVVICGLGRIGLQLAHDVRRAGTAAGLVVIERDPNNYHLAACRDFGAVILTGDATDPEMLRRARVDRASRVFAVSGDDGTDVLIAVRLCNLLARKTGRPGGGRDTSAHALDCFVHLVDPPLKELFIRHPLLLRGRNSRVNVKVFNVFTNSARRLIREHLARDRSGPPAARRPRENEVAHYVVVGFGRMGQAFALEAARLAHFENTKRLRMTILDNEIDAKRNRFIARYPRFCPQALRLDDFDSAADDWASQRYRPTAPYQVGHEEAVEYACNAEFLQMAADFRADRLADELRQRLDSSSVQPRILVCLDEDGRNFEAAMLLQAKLSHRCVSAPVYVWLPVQAGLTELLSTAAHSAPTPGDAVFSGIENLIPFGACEKSCNLEEIIRPGSEELARAVHEYYRQRFPHPAKASSKPWDDLVEPYRTANFLVAEHLDVKLLAIGRRRVPEAEAPPDRPRDVVEAHEERLLGQIEHNRWLAQQLLDGWSHGPERHEERKQSPDICAWRHLPAERRERDFSQVRCIPEIPQETPIRECIVPE